jgi:hypothetical protein
MSSATQVLYRDDSEPRRPDYWVVADDSALIEKESYSLQMTQLHSEVPEVRSLFRPRKL